MGAIHLLVKLLSGMDVVDKINSQPIDKREAPINNIKMNVEILE